MVTINPTPIALSPLINQGKEWNVAHVLCAIPFFIKHVWNEASLMCWRIETGGMGCWREPIKEATIVGVMPR